MVRRDNTFLGKVDFEAGAGRLSVTASRMRPFASVPRIQINNDQQYTNGSKRISTNYVLDEQFVALRKPVRLESQYARSLRRVLARGIADARGPGRTSTM